MSEPVTQPKESPSPCSPTCCGWDVFVTSCGLEIQRCDECWTDVPNAPDDEYYRAQKMCQVALAASVIEADLGQPAGATPQREVVKLAEVRDWARRHPEKMEELMRDEARNVLELIEYIVLPPDPADLDEEEVARVLDYLRKGGHLPEPGKEDSDG
jgi:hypothetical protein